MTWTTMQKGIFFQIVSLDIFTRGPFPLFTARLGSKARRRVTWMR